MKKLLLVSTALAGVALMSAPASAAVKLDLGGFFRGYGVYADNNEATGAGSSLYKFEFRRDAELHANGETTLDNGLTIGAHAELKIANGANSVLADEEYAYASGGWGRFNLGVEDGSAYLLQVAAPSADSNVDGMRVTIQALNMNTSTADFTDLQALSGNSGAFLGNVDYQQADFRQADRLTYLTPKFNGFQAGASFAPKQGITSNTGSMAFDEDGIAYHDDTLGTNSAADYKNLWEASARYDGEFEGFGFGIGGGYSDSSIEAKPTTADLTLAAFDDGDYYLNEGIRTWNAGLNIASQGFSLGGAYKHALTTRITNTDEGGTDNFQEGDITSKTWVVGAAYDNGDYHVGASYLKNKTELDAIINGADSGNIDKSALDTTKYAVGGGYTFGPGMTFRGAVAWGKFDDKTASSTPDDDNRFTQVTVGTDIQF